MLRSNCCASSGQWIEHRSGVWIMATVHPAYVPRVAPADRTRVYAQFVADLRRIPNALSP
jgi:hypothetical protein